MIAQCHSDVQQIRDGADTFNVTVVEANQSSKRQKRVRRLEASAAQCFKADLPIIGIGHSIGAVTLLALAGGEAQTLAGDTVISG